MAIERKSKQRDAIINELWESYGKPISEAVQEAISGIADIFLKLWEQFLKPIIEKIMVIIALRMACFLIKIKQL